LGFGSIGTTNPKRSAPAPSLAAPVPSFEEGDFNYHGSSKMPYPLDYYSILDTGILGVTTP